MEIDDKSQVEVKKEIKPPTEFKKPVLIGKIGKLPRKVEDIERTDKNSASNDAENEVFITSETSDDQPAIDELQSSSSLKKAALNNLSPAELLKEKAAPPMPYKEPKWSGLPPQDSGYKFEVLKSGTIVETIDVTDKPFHVFGRLCNCDIMMAHPTISRYHAVLQYKAQETDDNRPCGFYVYDLGSSHGTIINKTSIKSHQYYRVQVGHMIKLGCSTRMFILQGPDEDKEAESELSMTEMKQLRLEKKLKKEEEIANAKAQIDKEKEERERKLEQEGISWGMGDDADEETDLSENPYASANNEELYLEDPKKTLRGYFEREGLTLEYDCKERGVGQYVCRVELPIEDARGNPIVAEVIHKGKKKDAVIQCALEACRVIDRHGLLRQAKHESRKRKSKNWKDDDFYDSDDDTYLDRTGTIEKKREQRLKVHQPSYEDAKLAKTDKTYTYKDLVDNCTELKEKINKCDKRLMALREQGKSKKIEEDNEDTDALDQFMTNLGKQDHNSIANKAEISKAKMEIQLLKVELSKMEKLTEIAKPALLPELIKQDPKSPTIDEAPKSNVKKVGNSIFIGKKINKTVKKSIKMPETVRLNNENDEFEVEVDSDEEVERLEAKNGSESKKKEDIKSTRKDEKEDKKVSKKKDESKKVFGPMRPPSDYVIPDDYYNQESNRDLPDITEPEEETY